MHALADQNLGQALQRNPDSKFNFITVPKLVMCRLHRATDSEDAFFGSLCSQAGSVRVL